MSPELFAVGERMIPRHRGEGSSILAVPEDQVLVVSEVSSASRLPSVCFRGRGEEVGNAFALFLHGFIVFLSLTIKECW